LCYVISTIIKSTGASNVALNSVLNGLVLKSNTLIPPGPGDEGVAVGCALYGLDRLRQEGVLGDNVKKETLRINKGSHFKDTTTTVRGYK